MRTIRRFFVVSAVVLAMNAAPVAAFANESDVCQRIQEELARYGWNAPICPNEEGSSSSRP